MLSTNLITGRRQAYALCAAEADYAALQDQIYGDTKCAAKNTARAMFYWWAQDVMERTPIATDHCTDCKCVTDEFACEVIRLMDPGCVTCGCGAPSDRPISCELTGTYGVAADVDASFESNAVAGQSYLIVSDINDAGNTWADNIGNIAYNGTFTTPTDGALIYNVLNNDYWVNIGGAAYPYFPRINANRNLFAITLTSAAPEVNDYFDRTVVIRISADGTNWIGLFVGSEQDIPSIPITATINNAIYVDVSYLTQDDACTYGPFLGLVTAQQEPQPTNSFRIVGGTETSAISPAPTGVTEFYPWDQNEWTVSFNLKLASYTPGTTYIPINVVADVPTGPTAYNSAAFIGITETYLGNEEYGFQIAIGSTLGTVYSRVALFPDAWAVMSDGAWHNVTLVRNSPVSGRIDADELTLWVDNTAYAAVFTTSVGSGFTTPVNLNYAPAPDYSNNSSFFIGDIFVFSCDFTINNLYIANHAASPVEVATICYPAAYTGSDTLWDRVLWIRARQPDDPFASPYIASNSSNSVDLFGVGDVTLVPDAPTWVVP